MPTAPVSMENTVEEISNKIAKFGLTRRGFLASAGAATAATLVGCGDSSTPTSPVPVAPAPVKVTDIDVLNFALNLEYLEAEFYLRAVTGAGVPAADGGGATITLPGSTKVNFTSPYIQAIAVEQAQTELAHIRALRATITSNGGTPINQPALDYVNSFNTIAFNAGIGNSFNPFADQNSYLIGALTFPDVGVTAYTGGAALLTSKTILVAAAGFQATEAYHAGMFRNTLAYQTLTSNDQTYLNYFNEIVQLRGKLGGGNETTLYQGAGTLPKYAAPDANGKVAYTGVAPSTIAAVDANAKVYARSTDQVLHIVYGTQPGTFTAQGGFFPGGMNGTIKTPTS